MRSSTWRPFFLVIALAAVLGLPAAAADSPAGLPDLLAPLLPAVVNVQTFTDTGPSHHEYFWGSGVIVEPSGVIVTNHHVIKNAVKIIVTGRDFPPLEAKPIFVADRIDLAVLKIDAGKPLPVLQWGDSDGVRIGDHVYVIGNGLGLGEAVTAGIVSALNRNIGDGGPAFENFIQTDATINHGNSGGAMVDAAGRLIAINTGLYSSPGNTGSIGIGLAMPANDAKFIVDQVIKYGRVRSGWAGWILQPVNQALAEGFGLAEARGALVSEVKQDSPAAGKVREGDVILSVGGEDATDTRAVARAVAEAPVGQPISVVLSRDGVQQTVSLAIAEYPSDYHRALSSATPTTEGIAAASPSDPGMRLSAITDKLRAEYRLGTIDEGVVVTEVNPGSAAADRGIKPGMVILRVREHVVKSPSNVPGFLEGLARERTPYAPLLIQSDHGQYWLSLPLAAKR
jgi:serine protease Do